MEHVKQQNAEAVTHSSSCTVYEYITNHPGITIAVTEINGRYPDEGYALNHECTEMAYILKGQGQLVTELATAHFSAGDVLLIPTGEKYFWEGRFSAVLPVTPAWDPAQHEYVPLQAEP